jgi:molybdopterin converting factor subunit 1
MAALGPARSGVTVVRVGTGAAAPQAIHRSASQDPPRGANHDSEEATVEIEVLLFASLRDRAGRSSLRLRIEGAPTVAALRLALSAAHPGLTAPLAASRIAVDQEFRGDDHVVRAGAEVAVIPPVSGG